MSSNQYDSIAAALPKDGDTLMNITLRVLKDELPTCISYDQIKMVLSYAQVRQHLRALGLPFIDPDVESTPDEDDEALHEVDEEPLHVYDTLEDLNLPTTKASTLVHSNSLLIVDLGSDFEDESVKPNADLTTEQLFLNGNNADDDDAMLGEMLEVIIQTVDAVPAVKPKTLPNKRVMYDSDSDDDVDVSAVSKKKIVSDSSESKTSRNLPEWMLNRPSASQIAEAKARSSRPKNSSIF